MIKILTALTTLTIIFYTANAQLDMYKVDDNLVYPKIYTPTRFVVIGDYDSLIKDLIENLEYVNSYEIDDKNKSVYKKDVFVFDQLPNLSFKKITPEKYLLNINKNTENLHIILNESFHGAWEIKYLGSDNFDCSSFTEISDFGVKECNENRLNFIEDIYFSITAKKYSVENRHYIANGLMNGFYLDYAQQGTYLLSFRVQNCFYIGLIVSFIGFLLPFSYLIYFKIKLHNKKK